jgi:hypothetical protein
MNIGHHKRERFYTLKACSRPWIQAQNQPMSLLQGDFVAAKLSPQAAKVVLGERLKLLIHQSQGELLSIIDIALTQLNAQTFDRVPRSHARRIEALQKFECSEHLIIVDLCLLRQALPDGADRLSQHAVFVKRIDQALHKGPVALSHMTGEQLLF